MISNYASLALSSIKEYSMGWLKKLDSTFFIVGRSLLGLYFIVFGLSKVFDFASTLALMRMKGVPFSLVLLPLTIVIQLLGGIFLVLGRNLRLTAFILFGLTIVINLFIHNFWALTGDLEDKGNDSGGSREGNGKVHKNVRERFC